MRSVSVKKLGVVTALGVGTLSSGCVDTSPDRVKLTASLADVSLTVTQSSLATSLAGSFTLNLDLGDLAQENATVTDPPTFQLVTSADRRTIVSLDALVQGVSFPITVTPGKSVAVPYKLNDQQSFTTDAASTACAGDVVVTAALKDSSNGDKPLTVDSGAAKPAGCP